MSPFKKILVATDFSQHAVAALRIATQLASADDDALCVVHVLDLLPYSLPDGIPIYDANMIGQLREDAARRMSTARTEVLKNVRHAETKILEGQPSREIVRIAKEWGADLIVMGTHGRRGFAHLFLGSVAERVVRTAPCPVLTVPMRDDVRS